MLRNFLKSFRVCEIGVLMFFVFHVLHFFRVCKIEVLMFWFSRLTTLSSFVKLKFCFFTLYNFQPTHKYHLFFISQPQLINSKFSAHKIKISLFYEWTIQPGRYQSPFYSSACSHVDFLFQHCWDVWHLFRLPVDYSLWTNYLQKTAVPHQFDALNV